MDIVKCATGDHQQQRRADRHPPRPYLAGWFARSRRLRRPLFEDKVNGRSRRHICGVACVLLLAVFCPSRALIGVPRPLGAPCGALVTLHCPNSGLRPAPRGRWPSPWGLHVALRGGSGGDAGDSSWDKKDPGAAAPAAAGGGGTFEPHTFEARCLAAGVGGIEGTGKNSKKSVPWNISSKDSLANTFANLCLEEAEGRTCPWHALYRLQDTTHGQ